MIGLSSLTDTIKPRLAEFAVYVRSLKGDEKGEAQLFLERFFQALGHQGIKEAGATLEFRIAKRPGGTQLELITDQPAPPTKSPGGKKFADLLWPDRVLIEMKRRGEHLEKHYDQLFDYWTQIVPKRPPYAILCNFDELWVYDFNTQLFDPVDKIPVRDAAERWSSLTFLLPRPRPPVFDNNRVEVTRKAAAQMAHVFRELVETRQVARPRAQRFILQLLVALVSEDLGLLPDHLVTRVLADAVQDPPSSYDLLGGLFTAMNTRGVTDGGRFAGVAYFNGGLFEEIDPVELRRAELHLLEAAAREDWSAVKPEIFGTIFQQSMDRGERHAYGAHFSSEFDIQKVVGPTIVRPWRARIEAAGNRAELRALLGELRRFRVLDPACGSGNFLYVAYREMKRLERDLLVRLRDKGEPKENLVSAVTLTQFFGIDKVPFAVELARVTLTLAKELELAEATKFEEADGLLVFEKPLPLDNLEAQIVCADSLFHPWPKADAIIGNPPYLDARKLTMEHGAEYSSKVRKAFPAVPGRADFCVYWFRKAHDQLELGSRARLVGTNSIRQNYSREGGLDYIVGQNGHITEAISTAVWSGDAAVHVSIVNWIKGGDSSGKKKLSFQTGNSPGSPWQEFQLDHINSALSVEVNVTAAVHIQANRKPKVCLEGQQPGHTGFLLGADERAGLLKSDAPSAEVIFPIMNGDDLISGRYRTEPSWLIDLGVRNIFEAKAYPAVMEYLKATVLPLWQANAAKENQQTGKSTGEHQTRLQTWWLLKRRRGQLLAGIEQLPRYFVCSAVTKRPIFEFLSSLVRPSNALKAFLFADDYSYGVIQSSVHFEWFKANCSTLKGDFRYTPDTVFDTFPWPQAPTAKQARAVADAAVALRALRRDVMHRLGYSLRDLYRTLDDPGANPLRDAHAALDAAVRAAYAMPAEADTLGFLLDLNLACAAREKAGEPVNPPGLPASVAPTPAARAAFVTEDCIRV